MHDFLFLLSLPYIVVLVVSSVLVISVSAIGLSSFHSTVRGASGIATIINLRGANLVSLGPMVS